MEIMSRVWRPSCAELQKLLIMLLSGRSAGPFASGLCVLGVRESMQTYLATCRQTARAEPPMLQTIHVPPDIFPSDAAAVGLGKRGPRLTDSCSGAVRTWIASLQPSTCEQSAVYDS